MKRFAGLSAVAVILAMLIPTTVSAQGSVFLGGGVTVPMSDYKEYAKTGWLGAGGLVWNLGDQGAFIWGEGFYGSNKHKAPDDDEKTNVYGADLGIGYRFGDADRTGVYVAGLAGLLVHQYKPATGSSSSDSGFLYGGALGVDVPAGGLNVWFEGRVMISPIKDEGETSNTAFFGIVAGVSFPIGGGN